MWMCGIIWSQLCEERDESKITKTASKHLVEFFDCYNRLRPTWIWQERRILASMSSLLAQLVLPATTVMWPWAKAFHHRTTKWLIITRLVWWAPRPTIRFHPTTTDRRRTHLVLYHQGNLKIPLKTCQGRNLARYQIWTWRLLRRSRGTTLRQIRTKTIHFRWPDSLQSIQSCSTWIKLWNRVIMPKHHKDLLWPVVNGLLNTLAGITDLPYLQKDCLAETK